MTLFILIESSLCKSYHHISIKLNKITSLMSCVEKTIIIQITPLVSIVKLVHVNTGSKGNTQYIWNEFN